MFRNIIDGGSWADMEYVVGGRVCGYGRGHPCSCDSAAWAC